ncbi:MAG TPA: 5-formyltetrahydrofolate cyclo-ligase [Nitrososphaeraceae archaeon]|jgi:5-formyltetrahydrofolate cyclo-ligase
MKFSDEERKSILRKEILHQRNSLNQSEISSRSILIQENLIREPEFIKARSIGLYLPIGSEVETSHIITQVLKLGITLLLPRIVGNNLRYYIVEQKDFDKDSFDINKFGIKEPKLKSLSVDVMDILIIPGIVFDNYGYRIGYGYGYYDKYMSNKKFSKCIGLAFDFQFIKTHIPIFSHDQKIDLLITESGRHMFYPFSV